MGYRGYRGYSGYPYQSAYPTTYNYAMTARFVQPYNGHFVQPYRYFKREAEADSEADSEADAESRYYANSVGAVHVVKREAEANSEADAEASPESWYNGIYSHPYQHQGFYNGYTYGQGYPMSAYSRYPSTTYSRYPTTSYSRYPTYAYSRYPASTFQYAFQRPNTCNSLTN